MPTSKESVRFWEKIQAIANPPPAGRKKCHVIPDVKDFFAI